MSFSLEKTRLSRYVERTAVSPFLLNANEDNGEDQIEKILVWEKKICEFHDNARKTTPKIGKIYTDTVQKEFFCVKVSRE